MSWWVQLTEHGSAFAAERLRRLGDNLRNPWPFWDRVETILFDTSRRRWRTRGHGSWKPNDPDTIRKRAGGRLMHESGALERALTVKGAPGQKLQRRPTDMVFGFHAANAGRSGVGVWYGLLHQRGTGRMPRRVVLKKTPGMERRIARALREHLGLEG